MEKRPPVGTTLWIAEEHLYYSGGPGDPQIEFVIYPCEVKRYIVGHYIQMELVGKHPDGPLSVRYSTLGGIGKYLFDTPLEAALAAKRLTDEYGTRWAFLGYKELRRPWEKYLTKKESKT